MGRKPVPQPLTLADPPADSQRRAETLPSVASPTDERSPRSPRSPFRFTNKKSPQTFGGGGYQQPLHVADLVQQPPRDYDQDQFQPISSAIHPQQPHDNLTSPPPAQPHNHGYSHGHSRQNEEKASKSGFFFNFAKSSKSAERLHGHQHTDSRSQPMSRGGSDHATPTRQQGNSRLDPAYASSSSRDPASMQPSRSELSLASTLADSATTSSNKKNKPKQFAILGRSRSIRDKDSPSPKDFTPGRDSEPDRAQDSHPLRTAPSSQPDRSYREMMSSAPRTHSTERLQARDTLGHKESSREREHYRSQPSSLRGDGAAFLSGLKSSSSRAADMISKGLFGKGARSGSTTEREPVIDDEHYVLKVINLPLIEQTRLTRISKRLEESRDKTEFWMPAFPWRAIDYLNYKGTDVEGLYRVPGSGPQVKKWQRKFDEEYDVDLFNQDDLYDINIIGSMLKAWLRELPDELFPKAAQERIARECYGAERVPQMLIDELSNLSPFNYYLLFAITCHLSLLLAHSDKNKMDFRNLCICFQPCMKIDAFCFKFLVCDWRDCWKGCRNEAKFIEEEYQLFDQPPPRGISATREAEKEKEKDSASTTHEDRAVSSSESTQLPQIQLGEPFSAEGTAIGTNGTNGTNGKSVLKKKKKSPGPETGSVASASTISTNLTIDSQPEVTTPPRKSGDLRPLSPIKPLSPLGF